MERLEERDARLTDLTRELEEAKRHHKSVQQELEDAEAQVREARQKLDSSRQAVTDMHADENGFDPQNNDEHLEKLTKETVKGHRLADELKQAEGNLSEVRKKVEDSEARHQDIIRRIRDTYDEFGWDHQE